MPENVEIKARVGGAATAGSVAERAVEVSGDPGRTLRQEDTFFPVPSGRLKLRVAGGGPGELIHYERADTGGPKTSRYRIASIPDPAPLREALASALGVAGVVRKVRRLFLAGPARIHLDEVEGLGTFLEIEVVLGEGLSEAEGRAMARRLMADLGIAEADLVAGAYVDLLRAIP